jgi:hypothetical protein
MVGAGVFSGRGAFPEEDWEEKPIWWVRSMLEGDLYRMFYPFWGRLPWQGAARDCVRGVVH